MEAFPRRPGYAKRFSTLPVAVTKYQFNLKALLLLTLIVAVIIWQAIATVNRTKRGLEKTPNAYAAQLVAYMCIEHMKTNEGAWPSGWSQLEDDFDPAYAQSGQKLKWTVTDLRNRIEVNWKPDLNAIISDPACEQVIWVSNDPDRETYMTSPNEIISRYLVNSVHKSQ